MVSLDTQLGVSSKSFDEVSPDVLEEVLLVSHHGPCEERAATQKMRFGGSSTGIDQRGKECFRRINVTTRIMSPGAADQLAVSAYGLRFGPDALNAIR